MAAAAQTGNDEADRPKVFISYSRKDLAFVDRLEEALRARRFAPLIDRSSIYAFEDWEKRIKALILEADTVVFIISPDAIASRVCNDEVRFALSLNKRLAPIVLRRVEDSAVPPELSRLNYIFFDSAEDFERSADRLAEALSSDIEWLRRQTEYGITAHRWAAARAIKARGLLLRSPQLEEAEQWIGSRPSGAPLPTDVVQSFIRESRRASTRRRNFLTVSLGCGFMIASVLAGTAIWQRNEAVRQHAQADRNYLAAMEAADSLSSDMVTGLAEKGDTVDSVIRTLNHAENAYERLSPAAPSDTALLRKRALVYRGLAMFYGMSGDQPHELENARMLLKLMQGLATQDPGNMDWQRLLWEAYFRVGDALDDPDEISKSYQAGLAVANRISQATPDDPARKRSLGVSYSKIGAAAERRNDLDKALQNYRTALEIRRRTISDSENPWDEKTRYLQHDLVNSLNDVGEIALKRGNVDEALKNFRASFDIARKLVKADPSVTFQRDLLQCQQRVADALADSDNLDTALAGYRSAEAIADKLLQSAPNDMTSQSDLMRQYGLIGNVLMRQRKFDEALETRRKGLVLAERLAAAKPTDRRWQSALSDFHRDIGDALNEQGHISEALKSYREALGITQNLAASDPGNGVTQMDLSTLDIDIGDVLIAQGSTAKALESYRDGVEVARRLAEADPNPLQRRFLALKYSALGDALLVSGSPDEAVKSYRDSLAIMQDLASSFPENPMFCLDLAFMEYKLAERGDDPDIRWRHVADLLRGLKAKEALSEEAGKLLETAEKRLASGPRPAPK